MTQASNSRLERLNKKKVHPTQSFANLVSESQVKQLQPYVQQMVQQASQQIMTQVFNTMIQERSMMQTRQLAFERLLKKNTDWFSEDVLAMSVAEVEDEVGGLEAVTDATQEGDKVRLDFQVKPYGKEDWTPSSKLAVHSLGKKGPNGSVQTHEELEKYLVGMTVGETKEFAIPEPVEEGKEPENTRVKATVIRVSRVKTSEAPTVQETSTNE